MHLIVFLATLTTVVPVSIAEELRADDVPSACITICQPIVDLTNICDVDPNEEDSNNDKRSQLRLRENNESDEEAIEANCICTNTSFDVAAVMGLCASCMAQNSEDSEVLDVDNIMSQCSFSSTSYLPAATTIVTGIEVQATKPATTGISASTSTSSASSSTESAGNDAGRLTISMAAAAGALLVLAMQ
ncbi:hypothetical protein B0J13DRAFT_665723, partial [Dactylonectria estremocensis]